MYSIVTIIILLVGQVNAQYGEIASLISGLLAPNLNGATGGATGTGSGLLGSIGTLYQLAQGALQLTGTGVNILNQASEGKWFNAVVREAKHVNRELQERMLTGNGLEPDSSQFGISFAAPSPEDYDQEQSMTPESLVPFNAESSSTQTSIPIEAPLITLFPEEEEEEIRNPNKKENQNSMLKNHVMVTTENDDKIDHFENEGNSKRDDFKILNNYDHHKKQDEKLEIDEVKFAKLQQFLTLLHKNNITENELNEITQIFKDQKTIKSKLTKPNIECNISCIIGSTTSNTTASIFHSAEAKSKSFIPDLLTRSRHSRFDDITDSDDNDLLPSTNPRSKAKAVRIESKKQPKFDSRITTFHPHRKFPRRTAYVARLPFFTKTSRTETKIVKPKQSEASTKEKVLPQIRLTENLAGSANVHKEVQPEISNSGIAMLERKLLGNQFLYPVILNPLGQTEASLTTPIFGAFQTPALLSQPQLQAKNIMQSQLPYISILEGNNKNNVLWPHQNPIYFNEIHRPGQLNPYSKLNSNLPIPSFYNRNPL